MTNIYKNVLPIAAAIAVTAFAAAPSFAATVVNVDLWDKGSDATMADRSRI